MKNLRCEKSCSFFALCLLGFSFTSKAQLPPVTILGTPDYQSGDITTGLVFVCAPPYDRVCFAVIPKPGYGGEPGPWIPVFDDITSNPGFNLYSARQGVNQLKAEETKPYTVILPDGTKVDVKNIDIKQTANGASVKITR